ncbi:hypothetical protein [Nostoc sp. CHAB 5836]|nr:hypothetical protein [Nostoc sp. CHAB 5836]
MRSHLLGLMGVRSPLLGLWESAIAFVMLGKCDRFCWVYGR